MFEETERVPPWLRVEPGRVEAVEVHLAPGLEELRNLVEDPERLNENELWCMLVFPRVFWERKVRTKKSGEKVLCWSPCDELRNVQDLVARALFPNFGVPEFPAVAFGEGCSIHVNARLHRGSRSCVRMDLKNAFPSVKEGHIASCLLRHKRCGKHAAWVASRLLTFFGRLEQGAPIAPHLFNIMLRRMDEEIVTALGAPLVYTRYADDLVVSSPDAILPTHVVPTLCDIIARHGFAINKEKTRQIKDGHVDVPGIFIKKGRIRPNGNYVERVLAIWSTLTYAEREGHKQYVKSFGKAGRLKVFGHHTTPIAPRRGYEWPCPRHRSS